MEARNNEIINLTNDHTRREKNQQEKFNFFKNEYEKKINTAESIRIEQCNKIEQLNLLVTQKENETIGLRKEIESKSNQIVEINSLMEARNNEIIKVEKEAKILEHNKNEKEQQIITLKNKLISENKRFTENRDQLEKKYTKDKEKMHLLHEQDKKEILILEDKLKTIKQELAASKIQEELNQKEKDHLVKEIKKKEENLLIFALKINEQKNKMYDLNEQYKKLKNCWKEAEEKEARAAASSPKMDLISVNEHQLSSLHRLEALKEQLLPLASL